MAPKQEQCKSASSILQKGESGILAGLARIERDETLKCRFERDPLRYEIVIASKKLAFIRRRLALLECVRSQAYAKGQEKKYEKLAALLHCRKIFYRAQLDQARMQRAGRPIETRIACLEQAKQKLAKYKDTAAQEIVQKLDEEIDRISRDAGVLPEVPPKPPSPKPRPQKPLSWDIMRDATLSPMELGLGDEPPPHPRETKERIAESPLAPDFLRGMTYGSIGSSQVSYAPEHLWADFEHLRDLGVTTLILTPAITQSNVESIDVAIPDHYNGAPSMEDLRQFVPVARQHGFRIVMKPHIVLLEEQKAAGSGKLPPWRGDIKGKKEWFQPYRKKIMQYAKLAQELGVDLFVIGNELSDTTQNPHEWRETIRAVRKLYTGPLTYAAFAHDAENVQFYDDLDYVGVNVWPLNQDWYQGRRPEEIRILQRCDEKSRQLLQEKFLKPFLDKLMTMARRVRKPILLTEVGCKSSENPMVHIAEYAHRGMKPSTREQALYYETLMGMLGEEPYRTWIKGAFIWNWAPGVSDQYIAETYPTYDVGFSPKGPAQDVIKKYYRITASAPSQEPVTEVAQH